MSQRAESGSKDNSGGVTVDSPGVVTAQAAEEHIRSALVRVGQRRAPPALAKAKLGEAIAKEDDCRARFRHRLRRP